MRAAGELMIEYRKTRKGDHPRRLKPYDTFLRRQLIASRLSDPSGGKTVVVSCHAPLRMAPVGRPSSPNRGNDPDIRDTEYENDRAVLNGPNICVFGHVPGGATKFVAYPREYPDRPKPDSPFA